MERNAPQAPRYFFLPEAYPTLRPLEALLIMKILTTSFLTCAVKACKLSPLSFPLHYKDAELEQNDITYNPEFLINILPRVDWDAVKITASEVYPLSEYPNRQLRQRIRS